MSAAAPPSPTATLPVRLRADCAACVGLCCVALPFDAEQGFGFDKPAHTPCRHLRSDFQCGIHAQLSEQGFRGCTLFDCHGAGQRVTLACGERHWATGDEAARAMFHSFSVLRPLHELMALLATAQAHVTDPRLQAQLERIDALCDAATRTGTPVDLAQIQEQTMDLLKLPEISTPLKTLRRPAG